VKLVDVGHLGRERVIGAWLVDGCIVDCGPGSSLAGLLAGLGDVTPRRLLLTHIHLDHAGAAGALVARWPELEVWVHERGARHLAAPERLVASATRLYGDEMGRLWGEMLPVPAERIRPLRGGEARDGWRVAYTPGHASHHVAFLHERTGTAFVGDACGVRIAPSGAVVPPTAPPDIDFDAWQASLDAVADWSPSALAPTHFGRWLDVDAHLAGVREGLARMRDLALHGDEPQLLRWFAETALGGADPATRAAYEQAIQPQTLWPGLVRAVGRTA
jgi:glyoxylase-like metal-dependent hydrolase (beta-lactamase superfamily II)